MAHADLVEDPLKWSQLPDIGPYGYDWSSETTVPSMVADDFLCSSPLPVIDLHWWGSYYKPAAQQYPFRSSDNWPDPTLGTSQPPGILTGFVVEFYTDIAAGVDPAMPWSHPGTLLYEQSIPIASVAETYYGTLTHIGGMQENVWQYNTDLPVPFPQDPNRDPVDVNGDGQPDGTIYWLRIQAVHSDREIQWGWHEATTLWHDNAVQRGYYGADLTFWELLENKDMAFELTTVPEPSVVALVVGAMGVFLLSRRRGKRPTSGTLE